MSKIYDLHTHSTASDGVLSPTELVERAAEKGVSLLALTDHDTLSGLTEAQICAQNHNIELINGVEVSTIWQGHGIHIVGLNINPVHPAILELLTKQANLRQQRALEISDKLNKLGIDNAYQQTKELAQGEVTRAHYARFLVQIGKASNETQAFKRYLSKGKSAYVQTEWVSIADAINAIHQAAGLAVLAHPLRYKISTKNKKQLIADFVSWGGDAIEVAGCGQTKEQRQILVDWAKMHGLAASGGSDFHFPCGWIELGKDLELPADIPPIWNYF